MKFDISGLRLLRKYIDTLRASGKYGKVCQLLKKEKYLEAKLEVDFALTLDAFSFMTCLHKALKVEIEYELGNYDACKSTIVNLREGFSSNPELWSKDGRDVIDRVNWYWGQLETRECN